VGGVCVYVCVVCVRFCGVRASVCSPEVIFYNNAHLCLVY